MPRGGLASLQERYALDEVVLSRLNPATRAWEDQDPQQAFVDPFPSGAIQRFGEGVTGVAGSTPWYWSSDADVRVGDKFQHQGVLYTIGWVGPTARVPGTATRFARLSFAHGTKPFGGA